MEIKNLADTDLETIVDCLNKSFAGYYVQMSSDPEYWKSRFRMARMDMQLSFGCFSQGNLVAFILTGVDTYEGLLTAYNGGTGVIPEFRNQHLVDKLYEAAIPHFKTRGIRRCMLEVIEQNKRAIKVYERIGFYKTKFYHCFKGFLPEKNEGITLRETDFTELDIPSIQDPQFLCWDHMAAAMRLSGKNFKCFAVETENGLIGYFMLNPDNGYVSQVALLESVNENNWDRLVDSIGCVFPSVKLNNIDARRQLLIASLNRKGLENFINQFEMEKPLVP